MPHKMSSLTSEANFTNLGLSREVWVKEKIFKTCLNPVLSFTSSFALAILFNPSQHHFLICQTGKLRSMLQFLMRTEIIPLAQCLMNSKRPMNGRKIHWTLHRGSEC